jgi:hypothetical protein
MAKISQNGVKNTPKWSKLAKMGSKWVNLGSKTPKMGQKWPKMAKNGPKLAKIGQNQPKMGQNGVKMAQNGVFLDPFIKIPLKMDPFWIRIRVLLKTASNRGSY